ncbi:MAG: UDP-N-acetylmuramoyl-tripeptide--D-alanyl-D-alanine ligase [Planctomycetota bacterium]|jgi:UDP-N-acetylmuramoyl-tripeptide--D-alanyl-D-alanine ligase
MKEFLIADLAKIISARLEQDASHEPRVTSHAPCFTGVSTDSRTTQPGDCFFAIDGENLDGHHYVAEAFANGAVCAVVSKNTQFTGGALLKVSDTIRALGDLAREYRRQANFKVIAITGSVGKTTTRQIVYHVLSRHFRVVQAPKNFNNNIGLPLTLLGADPEHEIVIAELGSNHPGEIAYLTRIAEPNTAVVTNVHPAHLAGLRDLETIIQEKLSISEGLRSGGILIINGCLDRLVGACRAKNTAFITFGDSDRCDIKAQNITYERFGSRLTIDRAEVFLPLPGRGNAENALAAWAVCSHFGINIEDFAHYLKTMPAISMRTELLQIGKLTLLNDSYNANPASMKNALDILANIDSSENRRLVFICGDMAELGPQSQKLHAELGECLAQAKVRLLLTVGEFAHVTAEAAKRTAKHDLQAECFQDTTSACNNLQKFIKEDDIILVKGSRVARLEMAVEKLRQLFPSDVN